MKTRIGSGCTGGEPSALYKEIKTSGLKHFTKQLTRRNEKFDDSLEIFGSLEQTVKINITEVPEESHSDMTPRSIMQVIMRAFIFLGKEWRKGSKHLNLAPTPLI